MKGFPAHFHVLLACWIIAFIAAPGMMPGAESADSSGRFEVEWGAKLRAAVTPPQRVALGASMLEEVRRLGAEPDYRLLLLEQIRELAGQDSSGYPTALEAMGLLGIEHPQRRQSLFPEQSRLYELMIRAATPEARRSLTAQYGRLLLSRAGDMESAAKSAMSSAEAIERIDAGIDLAQKAGSVLGSADLSAPAMLRRLKERRAVELETRPLEDRLRKDPFDHDTAIKLVQALILRLDSPARAVKHVPATHDKTLERIASMMTQTEPLAVEQRMELGGWYQSLAVSQPPSGRTAALLRARLHFTIAGSSPDAQAAQHDQARASIVAIDAMLGKLGLTGGQIRWQIRRMDPSQARGDSNPQVRSAIEGAIQWLYNHRNAEGDWETGDATDPDRGMATGLATRALLDAMEDPQAEPRLAAAIRRLTEMTIARLIPASFRIRALCLMPEPNPHARLIQQDTATLVALIGPGGAFAPTDQRPNARWPELNLTVTAWSALSDSANAGLGARIPPAAWSALVESLLAAQSGDGSWEPEPLRRQPPPARADRASVRSTAGGLLLMLMARDHLPGPRQKDAARSIAAATRWLDLHAVDDPDGSPFPTNLYLLNRIAELSNHRRFGEVDLAAEIPSRLLDRCREDGGWRDAMTTAMALELLCRSGQIAP